MPSVDQFETHLHELSLKYNKEDEKNQYLKFNKEIMRNFEKLWGKEFPVATE